jgi:hypothetical protein
MKKILVVAIALIASVSSFGQVKQVVNETTNSNPVKLIYQKDEFTGKEYLMTESGLLVSDDGKNGFYFNGNDVIPFWNINPEGIKKEFTKLTIEEFLSRCEVFKNSRDKIVI